MARRPRKPSKKSEPTRTQREKALRRIRGVLGNAITGLARARFGQKKIDDLALNLARKLKEKTRRALLKARKQDQNIPLSMIDRQRVKVLKTLSYDRPDAPTYYRRKDGRFDKWVRGRKVRVISASAKQAAESRAPYYKLTRLVSGTFEISKKDARRIIKDVSAESRRKFAAFKKSAKYKRLSKRRKRKYTNKSVSLNALIRLQFLMTGESDPAGFHFTSAYANATKPERRAKARKEKASKGRKK
jgi:Holliday junction resolvasome RuvABC DNA-binding subunit